MMYLITEAKCPYCNNKLDPVPKKKKECPHCGKSILIRTRPSDHERVLATKEEAEKIAEEYTRNAIVQEFKSSLDLDDKEYSEAEKELAKKFGKAASEEDVIWAASNKLISKYMKKNDWQNMKMIYLSQAWFLYEIGQPFLEVQKEAARCELTNYQKEGIVNIVKILTAPDSCDKCKALASRQISIQEALETMPIPVKDCGNGYCRCCYNAVV